MKILSTAEEYVKSFVEQKADAFLDKQFEALIAKAPNAFLKMFIETIKEDAKAELKAGALALIDKIDGEVG